MVIGDCKRWFTKTGRAAVYEKKDGTFCFADGTLIEREEDVDFLPPQEKWEALKQLGIKEVSGVCSKDEQTKSPIFTEEELKRLTKRFKIKRKYGHLHL